MSEMPKQVTLTAEDLKDVIATAIREAKRLNPIEERKLEEDTAAYERRRKMVETLGKIEEENIRRKRQGCTHARDQKGHAARPGTPGAEWTTQGQPHGDGTITLMCLRCQMVWRWKGTQQEHDYCRDAEHGMLGMAPPAQERLLPEGEAA